MTCVTTYTHKANSAQCSLGNHILNAEPQRPDFTRQSRAQQSREAQHTHRLAKVCCDPVAEWVSLVVEEAN